MELGRSTEKSTLGSDKGSDTTKRDDLEKLETTKEGEILTRDAAAAKKEWIKNNPASPRNWPMWKKCKSLLWCCCVVASITHLRL